MKVKLNIINLVNGMNKILFLLIVSGLCLCGC